LGLSPPCLAFLLNFNVTVTEYFTLYVLLINCQLIKFYWQALHNIPLGGILPSSISEGRRERVAKQAVSVSIGSSTRDKAVEVDLLGVKVLLKRTGTDGDMQKAAALFKSLDGQVDAFGVGGTDLGLMVADHWYPLYSVQFLVQDVHQTPVADGTGLKTTLERQVADVMERQIGKAIHPKRVLVVAGTDRWGMTCSFLEAGYECIFGDFMFSLGLPIPLRSARSVIRLAGALLPVLGRVPFRWLYPTGKKQEKRKPRYEEYFQWASVIAGDCHYIRRYMPDNLAGKVIVTNTTTPEDLQLFRGAGVKYLVTTTPVLEGRSFGTNMMEAGLLAAIGRKTPVDYTNPAPYFAEMEELIRRLQLTPQIQEL
jgi:hypothetical protein